MKLAHGWPRQRLVTLLFWAPASRSLIVWTPSEEHDLESNQLSPARSEYVIQRWVGSMKMVGDARLLSNVETFSSCIAKVDGSRISLGNGPSGASIGFPLRGRDARALDSNPSDIWQQVPYQSTVTIRVVEVMVLGGLVGVRGMHWKEATMIDRVGCTSVFLE